MGIIVKRLENLKSKFSETICIELFKKKKLRALFAYRPPKQNKISFFEEISSCQASLSRIVNKYITTI